MTPDPPAVIPALPSPRARARHCLTILTHETGSASIRLKGLTLNDIVVDLETRLADAIAAAEEDAETLTIAQALSHWFAQGGESRYGALEFGNREPANADELISAILARLRKVA